MIAHIVPFAGRVGCLLTCLLGLTAAPGAAIGQAVNPQDDSFTWSENGNLPTWVVPVLKLVSSTHVEPTTGVVLSKDGLVLVPDSFASPGDEIIVLDGGTDILRTPAIIPHQGDKCYGCNMLAFQFCTFLSPAFEDLTVSPPHWYYQTSSLI